VSSYDPDSVLLYRYANESWAGLQTEICGEDVEFFYFESKTPGFSPFAITGQEMDVDTLHASVSSDETGENPEPELGSDNTSEIRITRETPENGPEKGMETPAPGMVASIVLLLAGAVYLKKR